MGRGVLSTTVDDQNTIAEDIEQQVTIAQHTSPHTDFAARFPINSQDHGDCVHAERVLQVPGLHVFLWAVAHGNWHINS